MKAPIRAPSARGVSNQFGLTVGSRVMGSDVGEEHVARRLRVGLLTADRATNRGGAMKLRLPH